MKKKSRHIADLVKMDAPYAVMDEVNAIMLMVYPDFDFNPVMRVFKDVESLFSGKYPGHRRCNTKFHDLKHTTDALMAVARLVHGASIAGILLKKENASYGLISALLHDTGYIQKSDETTGTGAQFTTVHIQRSIEFLSKYFKYRGLPLEHYEDCCNMLRCTDLHVSPNDVTFSSPDIELLGKMMGTADLLGQMADRNYLEKLRYLYHEFLEAGITDYDSEFDLLCKTPGFYAFIQTRLTDTLGSVTDYLQGHFKARYNIDRDAYKDSIEINIAYLKTVIEAHDSNSFAKELKRGSLAIQL